MQDPVLLQRLDDAAAARSRPLRIAIVSENWLPKVDGVTRTLSRLLKHLREQGHEAILLGPRSEMTEYEGAAIVGTRGIPLPSYKGLFLNFMRPLFIRRLLFFKPDIVHFVDPIWLGAQSLPAVEHFMPEAGLVSSFHTNTARYASLYGWPWLESAMWSIQRYLHGRCSVTFCPSPSTARALQDKGFENVRIWSRGADTVLFNPTRRDPVLRAQWSQGIAPPALGDPDQLEPPAQLDSNELVLVYVGRLAWEKNIKPFVGLKEAVHAKAGASRSVRLVLVGDGPARPELEKHCETHNLDNVLFMGHREGVDLARCYASADIFAFPSWTETFGQVVLEALSSGLPVVGLVAEGVKDLVSPNETGLLLDVTSLNPTAEPRTACEPSGPIFPAAVAAYRALLLKILLDHDRRKLMSQAAAAEASKHSWFEEMERLVEGYRDVRELAAWRRERKLEKLASLRSVPDLTLTRTESVASDASISEIATPVASPNLMPVRSNSKDFDQMSRLRRVIGIPRRRRSAQSTGAISPLTSPILAPVGRATAQSSVADDDDIEDMVLSSERQWRRSAAIKASLLGRSVVLFWLMASLINILWTNLL